ncbi:MAG: patatin-like phospholipase family protein [Anaerolineales bacterium]|nr:patatin-like phospholipase family protein [Anaerolineales bacterium]
MDITLALGGGGAKGNSHIGVLRRLEKEGYQIRAVAGTSFGGLVAILYAAGKSPDAIESAFLAVDQNSLYGRDRNEGPSVLGLAGLRKFLDPLLSGVTFENMKIPCAVTAVDVKSGNEVILSTGSALDAVYATIALPGIFPPHHLGDWELMDGGVLNPVPVNVARKLAPNLPVIAVSLNNSLDEPVPDYPVPVPPIVPKRIAERITRTNLAQAYDIFMRAVDLSSRAVAHYRLEVDAPDVIIRPDVHHIDLLSKVDVHQVALLGERATEAVLPQIKQVASWSGRLKRKLAGAFK